MRISTIIKAAKGAYCCMSNFKCLECPYNDYLPSVKDCKANLMKDLANAVTELRKHNEKGKN